jgi:hypothetical protein
MKKKGRIPEHHRQSSEDKWAKGIKALDDGEEWLDKNFDSVRVNGSCGYCSDAYETCDTYSSCTECPGEHNPSCICGQCNILVKVCSRDGQSGWFSKFMKAMNKNDRVKARKYAVKIYEYIKNDKPKGG